MQVSFSDTANLERKITTLIDWLIGV